MPTFSANQTIPAPSTAATLAAPAGFAVAAVVPQPMQAVTLEVERVPDAVFQVAQTVPPDRTAARLKVYPGPATPRGPSTPAVPRPGDAPSMPRP